MKTKKTLIDFSNHIHTTKIYKAEDGTEIREDRFGLKESLCNGMIFINHSRGMTVIGDFGAWNFCRQFIPSNTEKVYLDYFAEKAFIANHNQGIEVFDSDEAEKQIDETIKYYEENGFEGDELEKIKEWFEELKQETDELDYQIKIREWGKPDSIEYEDIPSGKVYSTRFQIIYEAFNEICERLQNKS